MNNPYSLEGKLILVTGAGTGIGQGVALELGIELALVNHLDREGERLGGRLRLGELGGRRWRQGTGLVVDRREGRQSKNEPGEGEDAAGHW